ncbi:hypothetical protein ACIQW7_20940 [Peribacillus simplex]
MKQTTGTEKGSGIVATDEPDSKVLFSKVIDEYQIKSVKTSL